MKKTAAIFLAFAFFAVLKVQSANHFQVGGDKGWITPPANDTNLYNEWARRNRFSINDTLRFEYVRKDSVMVVTKEEFVKCKSSNPIFFSDNGDTSFELNRSGYFYFISGVSGHCEHGLKMIVKVLEAENVNQPANQTSTVTSEAASVLKMENDALSQTLILIVGIIAMLTVFDI